MMKKINKTQLMFTLTLISLIGLSSAYGQSFEDSFGFESDDVNDVPINFLIPVALIIGAYLGIKKTKK